MFIFSAAGPTALRDCENHPRSVAATLAREHAIANINPDVVFIINFYEGFDDSYTVSIPQTTCTMENSLCLSRSNSVTE